MAQYRQILTPVDAVQFLIILDGPEGQVPEFSEPSPDWVVEALKRPPRTEGAIWLIPPHLSIGQRHGFPMGVSPNDWIIRLPQGLLDVVKGPAFLRLYQPA